MKLTYALLTLDDLREIQLREEDRQECLLGGTSDLTTLYPRLEGQPSLTARDPEGRIVAVFGFVCGSTFVSPWLLCSDLIKHHRVEAYRKARGMLDVLLAHVPPGVSISNRIAKTATSARAYVKSLGFVIRPMPGTFDLFYHPAHV